MEMQSEFLRGSLDTIVLGFLRERDSYGYEICRKAKERCHGEYELKETSLYGTFHRLESHGWIESYWGSESQGGRRKYYRITEAGIEVYHQNLINWEFAKRIIDTLLSGE